MSEGNCTYKSLAGYWECNDGYSQTLYTTWSTLSISHLHYCGCHTVRISLHYHNGCTNGLCSGVFKTSVQEY